MMTRRDFALALAGLPLALSLPGRAQQTAPRRLVLIQSAYGIAQANWAFTQGRPFDVNQQRSNDPAFSSLATVTDGLAAVELSAVPSASRIIEETDLRDFKSDLNVLRGLDIMAAQHSHNAFTIATASLLDVANVNGSDRAAFTFSLDMVLERKVPAFGQMPVPAIRVVPVANPNPNPDIAMTGFSLHPDVGQLVEGHESTRYRRLPYTFDARDLFLQLFGSTMGSGPAITTRSAEAARATVLRRISRVRAASSLGSADRARFDDFGQMISSLSFGGPVAVSCTVPPSPSGNAGAAGNIDTVMDLVALGLGCGRTNLACISIPDSDDVVAGTGNWHDMTHGGAGDIFSYERFVANRVAHLISRLASLVDVDGSRVLDNTLVLWVGELGDHGQHLCLDMPVMTFGGANLGLRRGRYLDYRKRNPAQTTGDGPLFYTAYDLLNPRQKERRAFGRPYNDLLVSAFRALGVPPSTYRASNLDSKYGSVGTFGSLTSGFGTYDYPLASLRPGGDDAALFSRVYRPTLASDDPLPGLFV